MHKALKTLFQQEQLNISIMKTFLCFLTLFTLVVSCKKETIVQDPISLVKAPIKTTINTNQQLTSKFDEEEYSKIKIRVYWASQWVSFNQSCISGYWYCYEITYESDAREFIQINNDENLIAIGIDNDINPDYNSQFMEEGGTFSFQDSNIPSSIVYAAIGIDKEIHIDEGSYPYEIIDGVITIVAPYTIVE